MNLLTNTNFNILGSRKLFFFLSAIIIICSISSLVYHKGPNYSIDFNGGILLQFKFSTAKADLNLSEPSIQKDVESFIKNINHTRNNIPFSLSKLVSVSRVSDTEYTVYFDAINKAESNTMLQSIQDQIGLADSPLKGTLSPLTDIERPSDGDIRLSLKNSALEKPEVKSFDVTGVIITSEEMKNGYSIEKVSEIIAFLQNNFKGSYITPSSISNEMVGPKVGSENQWKMIQAVFLSLLVILVYIAARFPSWYFGVGAIVALFHDVLITLGVFSVFNIEVSLPIIAAFLTIVGYSLNDTIVIFDRIRENMGSAKKLTLIEIFNKSINQSLSRTIVTSLTTIIVVVILFVFGSATIKTFAGALIIGVITGTYSSIYIASPVVLYFLNKRK